MKRPPSLTLRVTFSIGANINLKINNRTPQARASSVRRNDRRACLRRAVKRLPPCGRHKALFVMATTTTKLRRALVVVVGLLIVKVTVEVMLGYVNYFPPYFGSDFLRGRERYFFGAYQWAFYPHIASGPLALFLGLLLLSERFRLHFPKWHRNLGRLHVANVLCVLAPSGLWMANYALNGPVASVGFVMQSILTGTCAVLGWRAAMKRQFPIHRRWMWRCFLLLSSAVVIRLLGGLGTVMEVHADWYSPAASWASWVVPLMAFELSSLKVWKRSRRLAQSISPRPSQ